MHARTRGKFAVEPFFLGLFRGLFKGPFKGLFRGLDDDVPFIFNT